MKYIFIGVLLNSLVTSKHSSLEECLGREAILKEKGVIGQCVGEPSIVTTYDNSNGLIIQNAVRGNR